MKLDYTKKRKDDGVNMNKLIYKILGIIIILLCIFIIEQSTHKKYYTEYGRLVDMHTYATVDGIGIEYTIKEVSWSGTTIPVFATIIIGVIIGLILVIRTQDIMNIYNTGINISSLLLVAIVNVPILVILYFQYVQFNIILEWATLVGIVPFLIISGLYKKSAYSLYEKIIILFCVIAFMISLITFWGYTEAPHHHGDWGRVDLNGFTLFITKYSNYLYIPGFIAFKILNALLLIIGGIVYFSALGFRKWE